MDQLLQDTILMGPIYNGSVRFGIVPRLGTELRPKKLVDFGRTTVKTESDIRNVGNGSFNAVTRAFDFTKNSRHFVAICWVAKVSE